jgi:hypothetical protein
LGRARCWTEPCRRGGWGMGPTWPAPEAAPSIPRPEGAHCTPVDLGERGRGRTVACRVTAPAVRPARRTPSCRPWGQSPAHGRMDACTCTGVTWRGEGGEGARACMQAHGMAHHGMHLPMLHVHAACAIPLPTWPNGAKASGVSSTACSWMVVAAAGAWPVALRSTILLLVPLRWPRPTRPGADDEHACMRVD